MKQTHHKKLPDRVCPKCGATEGVARVMNYYACDTCYKNEKAAKEAAKAPVTSK